MSTAGNKSQNQSLIFYGEKVPDFDLTVKRNGRLEAEPWKRVKRFI